MNFRYGKKEMEYLKSRDRRLGEVIGQIGRIRWTVEPDLFSAIVQNIVSQYRPFALAAFRSARRNTSRTSPPRLCRASSTLTPSPRCLTLK